MGQDFDPATSSADRGDHPGYRAGADRPQVSKWAASVSQQFREKLEQTGGKIGAGPADTLLESIFQSITDGVIVADCEGRFTFFNEAARSILGLGPVSVDPAEWSEAYGCYLADKVTPYQSGQLPLARALRGEHVYDADIFVRNDGCASGKWISVNSSPLRDGSGAISGGVVVFRDITKRRESYELVARLSEAVERTTDSVFITDLKGRIEYVNSAFERTTGYTREEAFGQTPRILKSGLHDKEYYDKLWSIITSGDVYTGTVINRKKNGEIYHAEQTITPVREAAGNLSHFVSVVKDVTELKRAKEREVEMRLALQVQQQLYPKRPPVLPGFDVYGAALPADVTCGDYFDFLALSEHRFGLAIGDVRGHGFGSALLMVETRAYLRSLIRVSSDLSNIFRQLNRTLCEDTEDNTFVTLMLADIDLQRRKLAYTSAGHVPSFVLGAGGEIKHTLPATGLPLGLFQGRNFPSRHEIQLEGGDLIVLLTDGVTELENPVGEFFGAERVLDVIRANRLEGGRRIVERLHEALHEYAGGKPSLDDITIVVCKVLD